MKMGMRGGGTATATKFKGACKPPKLARGPAKKGSVKKRGPEQDLKARRKRAEAQRIEAKKAKAEARKTKEGEFVSIGLCSRCGLTLLSRCWIHAVMGSLLPRPDGACGAEASGAVEQAPESAAAPATVEALDIVESVGDITAAADAKAAE